MNLIITKWLLVYVPEHKHNFQVQHFLSLTAMLLSFSFSYWAYWACPRGWRSSVRWWRTCTIPISPCTSSPSSRHKAFPQAKCRWGSGTASAWCRGGTSPPSGTFSTSTVTDSSTRARSRPPHCAIPLQGSARSVPNQLFESFKKVRKVKFRSKW